MFLLLFQGGGRSHVEVGLELCSYLRLLLTTGHPPENVLFVLTQSHQFDQAWNGKDPRSVTGKYGRGMMLNGHRVGGTVGVGSYSSETSDKSGDNESYDADFASVRSSSSPDNRELVGDSEEENRVDEGEGRGRSVTETDAGTMKKKQSNSLFGGYAVGEAGRGGHKVTFALADTSTGKYDLASRVRRHSASSLEEGRKDMIVVERCASHSSLSDMDAISPSEEDSTGDKGGPRLEARRRFEEAVRVR